MALIECSNCGGKISDSAKVCPHCGYNFVESLAQKERSKEFSKLTKEEQKEIRNEYDSLNPDLLNAEVKYKKQSKKLLILALLSCLPLILAIIILLVAFGCNAMEWGLLIPAWFFLLLSIVSFVVFCCQKNYNKERLRQLKKFQTWLKKYKQMNYTIIFSSDKEKQIFKSFTEEE